MAILVQTAREDGRTVNAAGNGAAAEGAGAAEDADAEPGAELGEEWTSEQLSNAALLVSSVLAAHAAGQPAVRSQESFAVPRTLNPRFQIYMQQSEARFRHVVIWFLSQNRECPPQEAQ